jgi:hypothetical protein
VPRERRVASVFHCHAPPPGLAFGEPDDRLLRGIQYAAASRLKHDRLSNTWIARPSPIESGTGAGRRRRREWLFEIQIGHHCWRLLSPRRPGQASFRQRTCAVRREREPGSITTGARCCEGRPPYAVYRWIPRSGSSRSARTTGQGPARKAIRSPILTIFWHCGFAAFSFRTTPGCILATNRQRFWPRIARSQGLAMPVCSETFGVRKGAAQAVGPCALAAAPLPALLIGGLLLLSCP